MTIRTLITHARLLEVLHYDPETGRFIWKMRLATCIHVGDVAGTVCKRSGYRIIRIDSVLYVAHRLAWLYMTGEWPVAEMDHRNLVRFDNRFENLREATHAQNNHNTRVQKNSKSGRKGVFWNTQSCKWNAKIMVNRRSIHLGSFRDIETAAQAYIDATIKYRGEFARVE